MLAVHSVLWVPLWLIAGGVVGTVLAGLVEAFSATGRFWPWPICRACPSRLLYVPIVGPLVCTRAIQQCPHHPPLRLIQAQAALGLTAAMVWAHSGANWNSALVMGESTVLWAILFIDLQHRVVPTFLILVAALWAVVVGTLCAGRPLLPAMMGGVVAFLAFEIMVLLAGWLLGQGAFGQGDANLAGLIGLCFGYPGLMTPLVAGVLLGGVGSVWVLLRGQRDGLRATMPYAPFLVAGALWAFSQAGGTGPT